MRLLPILLLTTNLLVTGVAVAESNAPVTPSPTLQKVRSANELKCGVDFEEVEYSTADAHGNHSRFDLDLCKAIAVAVLGPNAHFTAVPYRAEADALKGLKAGEVDVLATATPNLVNRAGGAYGFSRPVFYDYQGFLVNKSFGVHAAKDLAGKKVCFIGGTEIEDQIAAYMKRESIKWLPFSFQEEGEMEAAFVTGNCAAITADVSQLAFERIAFKGFAAKCEILPDVVAHDPLALSYRTGDPQWAAIVDWVVNGLVQAEESGITQANVAAMRKQAVGSGDMVVERLVGIQKGYGQFLGLDDVWVANMVEAVGNYGEIFERDLGVGSKMGLERGANNLRVRGGMMVADPIR